MPRPIYTLLVGALVLAMCKKESIAESPVQSDPAPDTELTRGLPGNPNAVQGYFLSVYNYDCDVTNGTYSTMTCYAQFCDPPSNLMSSFNRNYRPFYSPILKSQTNVDMGNVSINNYYLTKNNENGPLFYYALSYSDGLAPNQRVIWTLTGNEIIPGFEQKIKDEFPLPKTLELHAGIDCKKDYTVRPADYLDRWDSMIVQLKGKVGFADYTIQKRTATDTLLTFKQNELDFFQTTSNANLILRAYRYFHRNIGGRLYVFELGTSVEYKFYMVR